MSDRTAKVVLTPGLSVVEVDGTDLAQSARSVQITATVGAPPRLVLEFPLHEIKVEGEMQVAVTDRVAEALISLGWTPPGD